MEGEVVHLLTLTLMLARYEQCSKKLHSQNAKLSDNMKENYIIQLINIILRFKPRWQTELNLMKLAIVGQGQLFLHRSARSLLKTKTLDKL